MSPGPWGELWYMDGWAGGEPWGKDDDSDGRATCIMSAHGWVNAR